MPSKAKRGSRLLAASAAICALLVACALLRWMSDGPESLEQDALPAPGGNDAEASAHAMSAPSEALAATAPETAAPALDSLDPLAHVPDTWRTSFQATGVVEDEAGRPLAGASVSLLASQACRVAARDVHPELSELQAVLTDASGSFLIQARPVRAAYVWPIEVDGAGPQLLRISAPGRVAVQVCWPQTSSLPLDIGTAVLWPEVRLHGRLVDAEGRAVAGGTVAVRLTASVTRGPRAFGIGQIEERASVVAGDDGTFLVSGLPAGRLHLEAAALGRGVVARDAPEARAGEVVELGDLVLEPRLQLRGRVLTTAGAPLRNVLVELRAGRSSQWWTPGDPSIAPWSMRTDAEGRFAFEGLDDAPLDVQAFTPWGRVVRRAGAWPRADLDLRVDLYPRVMLHVQDEGGAALAGCKLSGCAWTPRDAGNYEVADTGRRLVAWVSLPGRAPRLIDVPRAVPATIVLGPAIGLAGRVVDDAGAPVPGACVDAAPETPESSLRLPISITDAEGRFRIEGLAAGRWMLRARAEQHLGEVSSTVELDAGTHDELELRLQRGARLRVEAVVVPPGPRADEALRHTSLRGWLDPTNEHADGFRRLDETTSGRWDVAGLVPGDYELTVNHVKTPVTLRNGELTDVHVEVPAPAELLGTVLDPDGRPWPGCSVRWRTCGAWDGAPLVQSGWGSLDDETVVADGDGRFRALLEPCDSAVLVACSPGGGDFPPVEAVLRAGETTVVVLQADGDVVRGLVVDAASGAPVEGASVADLGAPPLLTDAAGAFSISHCRGRALSVRVSASGFREQEVELPALDAADRPPTAIRLEPASAITVRVQSARGAVITKGFRIVVRASDPRLHGLPQGLLCRYVEGDVTRFDDLGAGSYTVSVADLEQVDIPGFPVLEVRLERHEEARVTLTLP